MTLLFRLLCCNSLALRLRLGLDFGVRFLGFGELEICLVFLCP